MTHRPEPTDADVERLCGMLGQAYNANGIADDTEAARSLLAAGVSLPPEPDPSQERYYVEETPDGDGWGDYRVRDRQLDRLVAVCDGSPTDAVRIARLLNADERYRDELGEGGVVVALADAEAALELVAARVKELEGAERVGRSHIAHLDARVKELEGELAEANIAINGGCSCPAPYVDCPHDEPLLPALNDARAKLAEWAAKQAESQAAISSLRSRAEEAEARVRLLEGEAADRVEPLFTSVVAHEVESGRWLKVRIPADDHDKVSVHDKVDVYVHGARPAPRAITAEDVKDAIAVTRGSWYIPGGSFGELADALNARLAGDKPEGE